MFITSFIFSIFNYYLFRLNWFYGHQHNAGHMAPKHERLYWLTSVVTNWKKILGVKTTLPAGAKSCIGFSYSNPFSSYDHTGVNGGCNSDATLKGYPPSTNGF
jgi:hypothetical protein